MKIFSLKTFVISIASLLIITLGSFIIVVMYFFGIWPIDQKYYPTEVINYSPEYFKEKTERKFFYSQKNKLMYANSIDSNNHPLFQGKINYVTVAPDNKKAVIRSNEKLFIVNTLNHNTREILTNTETSHLQKYQESVETIYHRIQWTESSSDIFLIKSTYKQSTDTLTPTVEPTSIKIKDELLKYNLAKNRYKIIISPYKGNSFFLNKNDDIYFSTSDSFGDRKLSYYNKQCGILPVTIHKEPNKLYINNKVSDSSNTIFSSFFTKREIRSKKGVRLTSQLIINDSVLMEFKLGSFFKGRYLHFGLEGASFLIGDDYFLLDIATKQHTGQLLFDVKNKRYKPVFQKIRVYPVATTDDYDFEISKYGVRLK